MGRTPPPAPVGPVDPFNCAVDAENTWAADKKAWCCRIHHRGCPPTAPPPQPIVPPPQPIFQPVPQPILPARPADPYNCADGWANWQAGWSVPKKEWCCRVHGKGCPNQGGGCMTSSEPYDCNAGFANWMAGWSVAKKAWCCSNKGKGRPGRRLCLNEIPKGRRDYGAGPCAIFWCHRDDVPTDSAPCLVSGLQVKRWRSAPSSGVDRLGSLSFVQFQARSPHC